MNSINTLKETLKVGGLNQVETQIKRPCLYAVLKPLETFKGNFTRTNQKNEALQCPIINDNAQGNIKPLPTLRFFPTIKIIKGYGLVFERILFIEENEIIEGLRI